MGSVSIDTDLIAGAEELLAALKSQQPLTSANRIALLRQVDRLRCGLQGPAEAMNFQGTHVSLSSFHPYRPRDE